MRSRAIAIVIAVMLAVGCIPIWVFIAQRQAAQQRAEQFFGTSKEFPTSGGQKMKPEW